MQQPDKQLCGQRFSKSKFTDWLLVDKGGYGNNIATEVESFYVILTFPNGTTQNAKPGDAFTISNWRSGNVLPSVTFVMMDHFFQGPAFTKAMGVSKGNQLFDQIAEYGGFAKATVSSPNGLIPSPLITDVHSGNGTVTIGGPLQVPAGYSLILWRAENQLSNVTVYVTIRECTVNEETTLEGTLCATCDSNHFNLHPENGKCKVCPDHCNCSSWGIAPTKKHWVPSPCYPKAMGCLSEAACNYGDFCLCIQWIKTTCR